MKYIIILNNLLFLFRPIISLHWDEIVSHSNNVFEFTSIEPLHKQLHDGDEAQEKKEEDSSG